MNAAWESLHLAALELASCHPIKQRLIAAFSKHLADLDPAGLPKELRSEFESISRQLTRVRPLRGETAIAATVRKMSVEEAGECAQRIVALLGSGNRMSAPAGRPRPVVTLYSADA